VDDDDARRELMRPVLEVAIALARRSATDPKAPRPPAALVPFVKFSRIPAAALTAALRALDDDDFRQRVSEICATDDQLTEAQRAWLARDDGWEAIVESEASRLASQTAAQHHLAAERSSARQLDAATVRLAEKERQIAELSRQMATVTSEMERTSNMLEAAERRATTAEAAATVRTEERQRAVRELKAIEAREAGRIADHRAVTAELERLRDVSTATESPNPRSASTPAVLEVAQLLPVWTSLAARVEELARFAAELAEDLAVSGESLGFERDGRAAVTGVIAPSQRPGGSQRSAPRRRPHRLERGIVDGSIEAAREVFALMDAVAIVDGWNVAMTGWPALSGPLQRQRLIDLLTDLGNRYGTEIHVVFDGVDAGNSPRATGSARVRVQFTPDGIEADDRILEMIGAARLDAPVVVVSNDRRVRGGARDRGANVVSSELLLRLGST